MNCKEFDEKVSLYIDEKLNSIERKEFELHLLECQECRSKYEDMINIIKMAKDYEDTELPKNYRSSLRGKLEKENKKVKSRVVNWRVMTTVAAALLVVVVGYGIILNNFSFNNNMKQSMDESTPEEYDYGASDYNESGQIQQRDVSPEITFTKQRSTENISVQFNESVSPDISGSNDNSYLIDEGKMKTLDAGDIQRKIIKNAYVSLETSEFDSVFNRIISNVKVKGGYIERSETNHYGDIEYDGQRPLRRGNIQIRIPESYFDEIISFIKSQGEIKSEQSTETDITQQYMDTDSHVKNLEIQEERLREILESAKNVDEILRVENELRRIRTEIDRNKQTLKTWDSLIRYSTINVNLIEIKDETKVIRIDDESVFHMGKRGFISTINKIIELFERIIVMIMTIAPILLIALVILIVGIIILRRYLKNKK